MGRNSHMTQKIFDDPTLAERRLAESLAIWRRQHRWGIRDVATAIESSPSVVSRIETKRIRPYGELKKRLEGLIAGPPTVARAEYAAVTTSDVSGVTSEVSRLIAKLERLSARAESQEGRITALQNRVAYLESNLGVRYTPGTSPTLNGGNGESRI